MLSSLTNFFQLFMGMGKVEFAIRFPNEICRQRFKLALNESMTDHMIFPGTRTMPGDVVEIMGYPIYLTVRKDG